MPNRWGEIRPHTLAQGFGLSDVKDPLPVVLHEVDPGPGGAPSPMRPGLRVLVVVFCGATA